MTPVPAKQNKSLVNFSPLGQRRVLAYEKRIRRMARQQGFYAAKTKSGWELRVTRQGAPIYGPCVDFEIERRLDWMLEAQNPTSGGNRAQG